MENYFVDCEFQEDEVTKYRCPSCNDGRLKVKDGTFHEKLTNPSLKYQEEYSVDICDLMGFYSCLFECSTCNDVVSSTGSTGAYEEERNCEGEVIAGCQTYNRPEYFSPALNVFKIPKDVPKNVKDNIDRSFSLMFADKCSAINCIRTAIEGLVDELLTKHSISCSGSLHNKIEKLPDEYSDLECKLEALKAIGNEASHLDSYLKPQDLKEVYMLLKDILDKQYPIDKPDFAEIAKKQIEKRDKHRKRTS